MGHRRGHRNGCLVNLNAKVSDRRKFIETGRHAPAGRVTEQPDLRAGLEHVGHQRVQGG